MGYIKDNPFRLSDRPCKVFFRGGLCAVLTDIKSEERLVRRYSPSTCKRRWAGSRSTITSRRPFGPGGMLGRANEPDVVPVRDLRTALATTIVGFSAIACA